MSTKTSHTNIYRLTPENYFASKKVLTSYGYVMVRYQNWLIPFYTKIAVVTLFYSFLKIYSTSASDILRKAFYCHYLQNDKVLCKSVDIVSKVPRPFNMLFHHKRLSYFFGQ